MIKTAKTASWGIQAHKVVVMATDIALDVQNGDLMEDGLGTLHRKARTILKRIRDGSLDPETGQKKGPSYSISKAASLVGRTASAIREAERDGRLPQRDRAASGHRVQFTLEELSRDCWLDQRMLV